MGDNAPDVQTVLAGMPPWLKSAALLLAGIIGGGSGATALGLASRADVDTLVNRIAVVETDVAAIKARQEFQAAQAQGIGEGLRDLKSELTGLRADMTRRLDTLLQNQR